MDMDSESPTNETLQTMTLTEHIKVCKTYSDEAIIAAIRQLTRQHTMFEWHNDRLRALKIVARERKLQF